jgi:hypothetical protein
VTEELYKKKVSPHIFAHPSNGPCARTPEATSWFNGKILRKTDFVWPSTETEDRACVKE